MNTPRRFLIIILVSILAGYAWYRYEHTRLPRVPEHFTPVTSSKLEADDVRVLASLDAEYTKLVDAVVPSVVSITSSREILQAAPMTLEDVLLGRRRRAQRTTSTSLGSGVIVSKEGHILTNHHVVAGMTEIRVQLTDGRNEPARLIGSDPQSDIAVLRIDASGVEALPLGNSDELRVGQHVLAVGNPFGFEESVTRGIISAKGRRTGSDSGVEYIQTDAAVNQGNSGGPLINIRGEVIGINSAIFSKTGGWQGISFAIPSNAARRILDGIVQRGRVVRGWLGVSLQQVTPQLAHNFGLDDTRGALITDVMPGSPAEEAGLKPGDVLRKFNGRTLDNAMSLRGFVAQVDIGGTVEVEILRDGKEQTLGVKIAEMPDTPGFPR